MLAEPDHALGEPQNVLREFISAMHTWEAECWNRRKGWKEDNRTKGVQSDYGEIQAINVKELEKIFIKYCVPNRVGKRVGSWRHPAEYDPESEKITEVIAVGPSKYRIRTEEVGDSSNKKYEYVLVKTQGHWLLDSKHLVHQDGTLDRLIL